MEKKETKTSPKEDAIKIINNLGENPTMADIYRAISKKTEESLWKNPLPKWVFLFSGALAFCTFLYFVKTSFTGDGNFKPVPDKGKIVLLDYLLYVFWIIVPPSYFFFEYLWLFPNRHKLDQAQVSDLKNIQDLASKIWAALLLGFGVILFSKYGVK